MESIQHTVELAVPVERLFAYYTDPDVVPHLIPSDFHVRVIKADKPLREGSRYLFAMRPPLMPFEFRWLLVIEDFVQNERFSEVLEKGPLSYWRHSHVFESLGPERCRVTDTIKFGPAKGFPGRLIGPSFARSMLSSTFRHRETVLRRDLEGDGRS